MSSVGGAEYMHPAWGRVMIIGSHPHDGACVIVERMSTTDPDDDDLVLDHCEYSDLASVEGSCWPFLGFTSLGRARQQSREWGTRNGFAEVPEGSGRWQYPDGTGVPQDVWLAAWRANYLSKGAA